MRSERIVAVGLLTKNDVRLLGPTFDRLWPVQDAPCFSDLLRAIDDAYRSPECSSHLTQRRQAPDPID